MPRIPGGRIRRTKVGYAIFEHATELLQAFWQFSYKELILEHKTCPKVKLVPGSTQATSSVNRIRAIIPGIMIRKIKVTLISPASTHPNFAFERSLAARVR